MFKLMCFIVPSMIAVCIRKRLLQIEERNWHVLSEWLIFFFIINIFVVIKALPFGSVIISRCEAGWPHIQYGFIAIVMSNIYAVILGILGSVVTLNKKELKKKR